MRAISRRPPNALRAGAAAILLAIALLWPGAIARSPVIDPDTLGYMQVGEHTLAALGPLVRKLAPGAQAAGGQPANLRAVAKGDHFSPDRSAYYGLFIASLFALAGAWLVVLSQALIAGATVMIAMRRVGDVGPGRTIIISLIVISFSGLAAVTSTLMPDVFTGCMLLAIALLAVRGAGLSRLERGFLYTMVLAAMLFHLSHLMLATVMVAALAVCALLVREISLRSVGAMAVTVVLGLAGTGLVSVVAGKLLHTPVISKPFLLARVQADGPGAAYLHDHCAARSFALCKYQDRLPEPANAFLWSRDPRIGVIGIASLAEQQAILRQSNEIILGAVREHPLAQLEASSLNALGQFVTVGVTDYDTLDSSVLAGAPPALGIYETAKAYVATRTPRDGAVLWVISVTMSAAYCLALGLLIGYGVHRFRREGSLAKGLVAVKVDHLLLTSLVVLVGAALNAVICGVTSGVFDRYQGRVVWPVVLLACLVTSRLLRGSGRGSSLA